MEKESALAIVGVNVSEKVKNTLRILGFSVLLLEASPLLAPPVAAHADMLMLAHKNKVFVSDEYARANAKIFEKIGKYGYSTVKCSTRLGKKYPEDIAFNVFFARNTLVGNLSHTAAEVTDYAAENGIKARSVKQGYSKCSTLLLGENAAITADSGIFTALTQLGMDVLQIKNTRNAVRLDGYEYGFIGGASAVFENKVYFCGNIHLHPEANKITDFCKCHGFEIVCLDETPLNDIGGIIFLPRI